MFNGYNETPLISYEFNQERVEKKHENVPKWSYGHEAGVQPAQTQLNNRHGEFWSGKSNFLGIPNVAKCNCAGCYPSPEKQSYQGDTTRHRPWLPRTFPVPVNGSNESCKLPGYQWDNGLSNQGSCYPDGGLSYVQENGGKYPYYKHYQNSNQPGVITSVKNAEFGKKSKSEVPPRGQESPVQNGTRQPVFCNPGYGPTKRPEGRHYCDPNEKYSNVASYTVDQHTPRFPVVEPFTKAVPSNLSQSRVPSTGYRSVKENAAQSYVDHGFVDPRKLCTEPAIIGDKRTETFSTGQLQTGVYADYFNRELPEIEPQKLFFDNNRHPDYYPRANYQDMIKRNTQTLDNRKDCAVNQMSMPEQHFNIPRTSGNGKPSCDMFYSKDFEKPRPENHLPENSACLQRNDDPKNENVNVHARLPPSALLFNDPRFAERPQNSFPYQNNAVAYRNYLRPEYPYQGYNNQARYEYQGGFQRNDLNQFRTAATGQQMQSCEQFAPQQGNGFVYDCQSNSEKMQQFCGGKNQSPVQTVSPQSTENRKPNYLEAIRSEEVNKNGTNKISPLRLLRKKKFINVPQEPTPVSTLDAVSGLDVRKFWSTWADEEEENVAPTQMVVLDCQNIDPEQAKLLHLYETDSARSVNIESNNLVVKNAGNRDPSNETCEETKTFEQPAESKLPEQANSKIETEISQEDETEKSDECNSTPVSEPESKAVELNCQKTSPKSFKKGTQKGKKKAEIMDKWTEKKFDFLKRAEESKAAEILRHEEEKRKIFETRLSLQQSLKKNEKPQEKCSKERLSPFDENSQCESSEGGKDTSDLPTCEYRRNKFLDYSDQKVIVNGGGDDITKEGREEKVEASEIKKEDTKVELSEKMPKIKNENGFEVDDILKKMSDITFQCSEMKFENSLSDASEKKSKPFGKKLKKKKSEPSDNDERTDKLTVETATKPTIKFSIQKSHDLKISFKVLNSSKEYSDEEEAGGEDAETKPSEDSKNSTELITLKYKSMSESKKDRRRKKRNPKLKTLKIKKSRYSIPEEERDPLGDDEEESTTSKKPFSEERSISDGFQVQETMDSAKIKLTFKRHKGNFETEYKINSNSGEVDPTRGESPSRNRKKSRKAKKHDIFAEAGVETFGNSPEPTSDLDSGPENQEPRLESVLENSRISLTSQESRNDEDNYETPAFLGFPLDPQFDLPIPCDEVKSTLSEEMEKREGVEDGKWNDAETGKTGSEPMEFVVTDSEEGNGSKEKLDFPLSGDPSSENEGKVEILEEELQMISLDFGRSEKSQEIQLDCGSGTAPKTENDGETVKEGGLENFEELGDSETQGNFDESNFDKPDESYALENSKTNEDCKEEDNNVSLSLPSLDFETENCLGNAFTCEETNKVKGLTCEKMAEEGENEENTASDPNDKSINSKCDFSLSERSSLTSESCQNVRNESAGEKSNENVSCQSPPDRRSNVDLTQDSTEVLENLENAEICCRFESPTFFLASQNEENDFPPAEESQQVEFSFENGKGEESSSPPGKNIDPNDLSVDVEETPGTDGKEEERPSDPSPGNDDSGCAECSFSSGEGDEINQNVAEDLPPESDVELEDGEIVDSCEETGETPPGKENNESQTCGNPGKFLVRKIERRHSVEPEKLEFHTWSRKKFAKAKSCPPEINFTRLLPETPICIPVEDIPLPLGPPPCESCFDFITSSEVEKPEEHSPEEVQLPLVQTLSPDLSPSGLTEIPNPSPTISEATPGIFQRSSKIKFSFLKRSRVSRIVSTDLNFEVNEPKPERNLEKVKILTPDREETPKECQIEEVPNGNEVRETKEEKIPETAEEKFGADSIEPFGVEDLEESVEVIDAMTDFMRDEFYECEDIPTSEDLTNGEDLEIEKVNDDKFRNIMQNCLDNAKKFLNVGNLKLFSCSVDDLLGLDYQSSGLEENEAEKPTNHVSRDVLLTSCEDTNDDLGLPENIQPFDICMDFVPSFCSDVCPEILPVDNWPYLEEEVPSSPSKPNEIDLIPPLESDPFDCEVEKLRRKRVSRETGFRRRSLAPESDALCSKIDVQRRNTIECFNGVSYGEDMSDLENEIIRLKNEAETESSLKCRLSLDKINENGITFGQKSRTPENGVKNSKCVDYKSPSWQPKVMLFRISKNEVRKMLKSSKSHSLFRCSGDSSKRKNSGESEIVIKKPKSDTDLVKTDSEKPVQDFREEENLKVKEEKLVGIGVGLPGLDSIKGSLTSADVGKRKKSRFRNLHTRRKSEPENTKDVGDSSVKSASSVGKSTVDAEAALVEIFQQGGHRDESKNEKANKVKNVEEATAKKKSSESKSEKIREKSKEESKHDKHREKKHDHRDRRRDKSEGKDQHRHKDRHREGDGRKHERHGSRSSRERSKHHGGKHERKTSERSRSTSGGEDRKSKPEPEVWSCEVCGFDDASERVSHIKSHPFHCQSCHLAFKTEAHFISHLTKKHKDIRNQHHCLLCELSFDTENEYQKHLETREHTHLESVEKNTINTLFTLLTGAPCPVFGLLEIKPEWLPNQAGTVHFYHQATPLSLALQYLKMNHNLTSFSAPPSAHSS